MNKKIRDKFFEEVAIELGFETTKYYSARDNMFRSCRTEAGSSGGGGPV